MRVLWIMLTTLLLLPAPACTAVPIDFASYTRATVLTRQLHTGRQTFGPFTVPLGATQVGVAVDIADHRDAAVRWDALLEFSNDGGMSWNPYDPWPHRFGRSKGGVTPEKGVAISEAAIFRPLPEPTNPLRQVRGSLTSNKPLLTKVDILTKAGLVTLQGPRDFHNSVAYDNDTQALQNVAVDTVSFSHTCTGSDRGLAGWVMLFTVGESVSVFTYNSVALAVVTGSPLDLTGVIVARLASHYLHGPASGSNQVSVTLTAAVSAWDVSVLSVTGAHQTAAVSGYQEAMNGASTSATVTVTTGTSGDLVVDATISTTDNGTTSSGTQRWQDNSGSTNTQGATVAGGASIVVTENWDGSIDNDTKGVAAFNIAAAAAGNKAGPLVNSPILKGLVGGGLVP